MLHPHPFAKHDQQNFDTVNREMMHVRDNTTTMTENKTYQVWLITSNECLKEHFKKNSARLKKRQVKINMENSVEASLQSLSINQADIIFFSRECLTIKPENAVLLFQEKLPRLKFGLFQEHYDVSEVKQFMQAGYKVFLSPDDAANCLEVAILSLITNNYFFSNSLVDEIFGFHVAVEGNPIHKLTRRQHEIAGLYLKGMRSIDICKKLNLKSSTVATQKKKILEKLGVESFGALNGYKAPGKKGAIKRG